MYVHMHTCIYMYVYRYTYKCVCVYMCVYICMYMYVYCVCMCILKYICVLSLLPFPIFLPLFKILGIIKVRLQALSDFCPTDNKLSLFPTEGWVFASSRFPSFCDHRAAPCLCCLIFCSQTVKSAHAQSLSFVPFC